MSDEGYSSSRTEHVCEPLPNQNWRVKHCWCGKVWGDDESYAGFVLQYMGRAAIAGVLLTHAGKIEDAE